MGVSTANLFSAGFNSSDFMKLLVAQLKCQDPEEPMSNSEMVTQMASLSTVEGINNLNTSFQNILALQALFGSTSMIGRQVTYYYNGTKETGKVESVQNNNGTITLTVNEKEIHMGDILKVQ